MNVIKGNYPLAVEIPDAAPIYPPLWSADVEHRVRSEARGLDSQITASDAQQCVKCTVTSRRPRITFDNNGVCSACRFAELKASGIDWDERGKQLVDLLASHRRGSGYDVIVPASGGKDSSMVAHQLKTTYGMTPLCTKMAPHIYTGIGRQNWEALNKSGFDCLEFAPNGLLHRRLARLCLEFYGDAFQPFVFGQLAFPMQMAVRMGVNLVFGGENGELEYGGDTKAIGHRCWGYDEWERIYLKGAGIDAIIAIGLEIGAFDTAESRSLSDFYHLPEREKLAGVEYHHFGYYRPWWPMDNYYYAVENCGFMPSPDRSEGTYTKMASIDDATDGFHYWFGYLKFGIGRATSDTAQQIRASDIDRTEGLALVRKYDGEFPARHFDLFKDYLGLDDDQFWRVAERFRAPHVTIRR